MAVSSFARNETGIIRMNFRSLVLGLNIVLTVGIATMPTSLKAHSSHEFLCSILDPNIQFSMAPIPLVLAAYALAVGQRKIALLAALNSALFVGSGYFERYFCL